MNNDARLPLRQLKVDGGMTSNNLLMQTIADALDVPVVRPLVAETVSRGAAYAAGLVTGYWSDMSALRRQWHRAAQWTPQRTAQWRDAEYADWQRAVALTYNWAVRRETD
jgi:glycerol kinase